MEVLINLVSILGMVGLVFLSAFFQLSALVWTVSIGLYLLAITIFLPISLVTLLFFWGIYLLAAAFANLHQLRRQFVIEPSLKMLKAKMPSISQTEREALEAGNTWWEKEIFCGRPKWKDLFHIPKPSLSAEEQAFIDNQVDVLCGKINDWEIVHDDRDLPEDVWNYLKKEKFFGMAIPKEYNGLGFSALAHSSVIVKIATRSVSAAVTTMVPNSLGPAELLLHYGTKEQKSYYLPRLARGDNKIFFHGAIRMKRFYYLSFCSLIFFASFNCLAAHQKKLTLHDGFYIGAAGGYDAYRAKNSVGITDNDGDLLNASAKISVNGGVGGVVGGYGYNFNPFYLAGEIFWYATGANSTTNFSAATTPGPETISLTGKLSVQQQYGVSVLPGFKVNNSSLVYLRLGVTWAQIKLSETIASDQATVQSDGITTTQPGFNYGFGMETAIARNLSLRGEFNHSDYHSFKTQGPFNTNFKFSDNQYLIGLILHVV